MQMTHSSMSIKPITQQAVDIGVARLIPVFTGQQKNHKLYPTSNLLIQVNSDMMDSVVPGKLVRHMHMTDPVRHMQVCMLLQWGPHLIYI